VCPERAPLSLAVEVPPWVTAGFALLAACGLSAFIVGINGADPLRTWQAYLINFLFWTGLSFGQACFLAVLNLTGAKWAEPVRRLSGALAAYLPIGFLLFLVLYPGKSYLFPWIGHAPVEKKVWLNATFLFLRDGVGILLLTVLSMAMIYFSVSEMNAEKNHHRQMVLSTAVAVAYAFVMTLVGFDLVMSLDPHWYSSLFGGYFFIGSFYTGIGALYFVALLAARSEPLEGGRAPLFHDLGKLTFAFCLFTGYLFYAQFLVIWYGNMPEETRYVILRVRLTPWEPLAWVVFGMTFVAPFFLLISKKAKLLRPLAAPVSLAVIIGMWLEKVILVAPSLWKQKSIPLGMMEVLITAGFLGVFGLTATTFLKRTSAFPLSDPHLAESEGHCETRIAP
jgi:hypothetical protein